jgi:hypothetical protein
MEVPTHDDEAANSHGHTFDDLSKSSVNEHDRESTLRTSSICTLRNCDTKRPCPWAESDPSTTIISGMLMVPYRLRNMFSTKFTFEQAPSAVLVDIVSRRNTSVTKDGLQAAVPNIRILTVFQYVFHCVERFPSSV